MISGLENPFHLLILLGVLLLLFGAKRLPELGRSVGSGMREFKDAIVGRNSAELPSGTGESPEAPSADRAGNSEGTR